MDDPAKARDDKREQIFQAAVAEFQENGFSAASMDRVSARAGASKRTVYKHFESKEKLFQELICRHWAKFAESLAVTYQPGRSIRDQLIDLGHAEGRLLTSPDIMATTRMVMSEMLQRPELVEENEEKTDFKDSVVLLLKHAAEDGQLQLDDPRDVAEEFIALLKGKAFWPVVFLGAPVVSVDEMSKIVDSSVDMIMSRYGV